MEHPRPRPADGSTPAPAHQRQIGILLFDGVEELDAVGPWEVLSTWTLSSKARAQEIRREIQHSPSRPSEPRSQPRFGISDGFTLTRPTAVDSDSSATRQCPPAASQHCPAGAGTPATTAQSNEGHR